MSRGSGDVVQTGALAAMGTLILAPLIFLTIGWPMRLGGKINNHARTVALRGNKTGAFFEYIAGTLLVTAPLLLIWVGGWAAWTNVPAAQVNALLNSWWWAWPAVIVGLSLLAALFPRSPRDDA